MRTQDEAWKEKLRELKAMQEATKDKDLHDKVVEPVKADIAALLRTSGDSISNEGLETLAKWKLGA